MRATGCLVAVLLVLAGCGAARQPVIFSPEFIVVPGGEEFYSLRDFAPASAAWLVDSGALVPGAVVAALAEHPDSVAAAARKLCPAAPAGFTAGWPQTARAGQLRVAPAGDRFLVEVLLPDAVRCPPGLQLWLEYNLTRDRAEYLYFVAR